LAGIGLQITSHGLLLLAALQMTDTFDQLASTAEQVAAAWHDEYQLRLCGELLTAQQNLADGAKMLAKGEDHAIIAATNETRADLEQGLKEIYRTAGTHADGAACSSTFRRRAAKPRLERNPSLPEGWPNWVVHLSAEDESF